MAEKSYLTDVYGNLVSDEPVKAEDVTPAMRSKFRFQCCGRCKYGRHKGEKCDARMIFISASPQAPCHFREAPDSSHIKGCEYDEGTKARTKMIEFVDRTGKGQTPEDMLSKLLQENNRGGAGRRAANPNHYDGEGDEEEEKVGNTNITRRIRQPNSLKQLLYVLQEKNITDPYGALTVNEWLIDNRNVHEYMESGIRYLQPIIVICRKVVPPDFILRRKGDIVFVDAYSFELDEEPMYFVIRNASEVFREIVFEGKEKEFAVFGQWEPMGGHANVYVTYDLGERAILPLKEGDVWTAE